VWWEPTPTITNLPKPHAWQLYSGPAMHDSSAAALNTTRARPCTPFLHLTGIPLISLLMQRPGASTSVRSNVLQSPVT
jgi:hypothetical protein